MNDLTFRWTAVTSVLAACASAGVGSEGVSPPGPTALRFEPTSVSYLSTSHRIVAQEVQGRTVTEDMVLRYQITARVDSTFRALFTVDTVLAATAQNIAPSEIDRASGATFAARLAPTGRLDDFEGGDQTTPLLQQLTSQLREFYPRLPDGGLRPGMAWRDTTVAPRSQGGAQLTVRATTQYRAGGWVVVAGRSRLTVQWERQYRLDGTGQQFGQEFTLAGEGTASGASYFSPTGTYLGAVSHDELRAEILIASMGVTIPLHQTQADTVQALP